MRPRVAAAFGAGVVLHDGDGRILLGMQRDGWSTFAGKSEGDETPWQTARRECNEETLFVLSAKLEESPMAELMTSSTPSGMRFHLFALQIPYDATLPTQFEDVRKSCVHAQRPGCAETRALRWFRADELVQPAAHLKLRPSFQIDVGRIVASVAELPLTTLFAHEANAKNQ